MPANYLFAPLIALMFPNARIFLMRRHPLDVGLSCFEAGFGFGFGYATDLADTGRAYRLFADIVDRWRGLLGDHLVTVRYETLVTAPSEQIARVLDHCGLAFHPDCAAPPADGGLVKTASVAQVREPVTDRSVGRWHRFEADLQPMIDAMGGMAWIETHDAA